MSVIVCRGAMKLFADFYEADIIVASPLAISTLLAEHKEAAGGCRLPQQHRGLHSGPRRCHLDAELDPPVDRCPLWSSSDACSSSNKKGMSPSCIIRRVACHSWTFEAGALTSG